MAVTPARNSVAQAIAVSDEVLFDESIHGGPVKGYLLLATTADVVVTVIGAGGAKSPGDYEITVPSADPDGRTVIATLRGVPLITKLLGRSVGGSLEWQAFYN